MGTRVAPTYAIYSWHTLKKNMSILIQVKWFRFIDDIWGIFSGNSIEFQNFVQYLNIVHDSLKFAEEFSYIEINFLDVTTFREGQDSAHHTVNKQIVIVI